MSQNVMEFSRDADTLIKYRTTCILFTFSKKLFGAFRQL
jgi:hypothetical protein